MTDQLKLNNLQRTMSQRNEKRFPRENERDGKRDDYHDSSRNRRDRSPEKKRKYSPERDGRRDRSPRRDDGYMYRDQRRNTRNDKNDDSGEDDGFERDVMLQRVQNSTKNSTDNLPKKPQNQDILMTGVDEKVDLKKNPISLDDLKREKEQRELVESRPVFKDRMDRKMEKKQNEQERLKKIAEMRRERELLISERANPSEYDTSSKLNRDEILDLKEGYYDTIQPKMKQRRERGNFLFEWDASDDTSHDINPIYDQKHEALIQFGRASRGGEVIEKLDSKKQDLGKNWREKALGEMTTRDWRIFCEDFEIQTKGGNIANPWRNWKESGLPREIQSCIDRAGYIHPTPIQMQCIPIAMSNRDLIGLSETGSGKSLAYILPLLMYVRRLPKMNQFNCHDGPYSLILAPTRELALQIEVEAKKFADPLGIKVVTIIGGVSQETQSFLMREGCEILIATPGRLIAYLDNRIIVLNQCNYVVLDECDKMISMGFEEQVNQILEFMPSSNLRPENENEEQEKAVYRQTIMFSATMPKEIERLANKYMRRKIVVTIGEVGQAVKKIEQRIVFVEDEGKRRPLTRILEENERHIIVFVNLKKVGDSIQKFLHGLGWKSLVLHGKKTQEQRNFALESFKNGSIDVLIATDVMSRGIDIEGVKVVVNYDMPSTIEDYKHRIGRTGRMGREGLSISFLTNTDTHIMYDLKQTLQQAGQTVPEELAHHEAALIKPGTFKAVILN